MGLRDTLKAKVKAALLGEKPTPATTVAGVAPEAVRTAPAVAGAQPPAPPPPPPPVGTTPAAPTLRPVASASAVREGKPGTYAHAGYNVAIFRYGGRLYAIDNACAHEDGPIGEGSIEGSCVRCPYHDWQYDFTTGACLTDPERPRATFEVREAEGSIWLGKMLTAGSDSRGGEHDDGLEVIRK